MITPGARKTKRLRISQVEPWKTLQQLPSHCPNWVVVSFRFPTVLQNANCSTHFAGCTESLASNTWDRWRFFGIHGGFEMIQGCTGSLNIIACNNMLEFGNLNLNLSCKAFEEKTLSSRMVFANCLQNVCIRFWVASKPTSQQNDSK